MSQNEKLDRLAAPMLRLLFMHIAPYLAAFGLLTIYHSARVIAARRRLRVGLGDGGHAELERLIRVFGNHAEYVPMSLILLFALEYMDAPVLYLHAVGIPLLVGRMIHGLALSRVSGTSAGRAVGMVLTFMSLALGSVGVLVFSFFGTHR